MKSLTIFLGLLSAVSVTYAATDKIVCYFGSWAVYRQGTGLFDVEDIDPQLCTHIIYSFVGINTDGSIKILDPWNELDKKALERFVGLKKQKPSLKVLVAIGGWNEGSTVFSSVVNNPSVRATFVNNIVAFTKQYNFDGFDLDWEYPAQRGGAASDRVAFISLLAELRPKFDANGLILTAAVGATSALHATSYDVPNMSKYLDFINIMTYDFHGSYDGVTGQNAPLYASSIDVTPESKLLNVEAAVNGWINSGALPSKLVLGMGVYGQSFTLSGSNTILGASASGAGNGGPFTAQPGFLGYNEICANIKEGGWTEVWDDKQKNPYAYKGNQWIGYDNQKSIELKTKFAIEKKLGGAMIWSLETDDARNVCGQGKFPILQSINKVIKGQSGTTTEVEATTTKTETTKAPLPPTTPTSDCTQDGYFADPADCAAFYRCTASQGGFTKSRYQCSPGLAFDTAISGCNWRNQVSSC